MASNATQQRSALAPREFKHDVPIVSTTEQTATSMVGAPERKHPHGPNGFDLQRRERREHRGHSELLQRHRSGGKGRSARNAKGDPMAVAPFTMRGPAKMVGGKATRVYEFQSNFGNTAAASSGLWFGYSVRNTNAAVPVFSLNMYYGRADNATSAAVLTDTDFPDEAKHLCDTFKWMNIDKVELEIIPILKTTATATNIAAMPNSLDGGLVAFGGHVGNEEYYGPASGVPTLDFENVQRLPHHTISPIGFHSKTSAKLPQSPEVLDYASGSTHATYPVTPPIQTSILSNNITEYPFYGHWYYWNHPNLAATANLVKFIGKFRIQITWNTVQDTAIGAVAVDKEKIRLDEVAKSLAGQLMPGTGEGNIPARYYPSADAIFADPAPPDPQPAVVQEDYVLASPPATPTGPKPTPLSPPTLHTLPPRVLVARR